MEGTLDAFVTMTEAATHVRTLSLDLPDPDDDAS